MQLIQDKNSAYINHLNYKQLKYLNIPLLLLLIVFAQSCTERLDMDLEVMKPTPVITGIISNEEQWVKLSTTSAYLGESEGTAISGATVTVSDGITSFLFQELSGEKGLYLSSTKIAVATGAKLKLNVQADFTGNGTEQEYTAVAEVAPTPQLDSITMLVVGSFGDLFWLVQVNYQDVSHENSYLCRVYVNNMLDMGLNSYSIFDNRFGYGSYIERKMVAVLYERPFSSDKVQVGDEVKVSFSGITKDYFNFLYSAEEETGGRNPMFSGPPANVNGNISNGALGMFTAYQTSTLSVAIVDVWH